MLHSWILLSQVQNVTLVLPELHNVLISLYQLTQIFLAWWVSFHSFHFLHFLRQFATIAKFHQDTLGLIF